MNTFRDELYFIPVRITVFSTFRIFQKHPLPVNMAVVINKHKIREKSIDLLKESLENCLKYKQEESARERALCQLTECF